MNAAVEDIMQTLEVSDYSTDAIEHANAQLEALSKTLDGLGAEYSVEFDGSVIKVIVEPKLSYDKTVFCINVEERSFSKE